MTLTPARRDYLRQIRGEHMEGVEVVTITRTDLDALLDEGAKVDAVRAILPVLDQGRADGLIFTYGQIQRAITTALGEEA